MYVTVFPSSGNFSHALQISIKISLYRMSFPFYFKETFRSSDPWPFRYLWIKFQNFQIELNSHNLRCHLGPIAYTLSQQREQKYLFCFNAGTDISKMVVGHVFWFYGWIAFQVSTYLPKIIRVAIFLLRNYVWIKCAQNFWVVFFGVAFFSIQKFCRHVTHE